MNRKSISHLLIATLFITIIGGTRVGYASAESEIISETYPTVPVENYVPISEDTEGAAVESDSRPDGVVQMVIKTTPVESGEGYDGEAGADSYEADGREEDSDDTVTAEVVGRSSVPNADELEMYADDVINMVMPVIPEDTYDFVMDSQDLLSRFSVYKDTYEKSSLYFTNSIGPIEHTGISDAAMAKNKSSVPVLLYVTLEVTNKYGWPVNYTDMDSVYADEGKNLSFALIPVSSNVDNDVESSDKEGNNKESEEKDSDVIVIDEEQVGDDTVRSSNSDGLTKYKDHMISIDESGKAEMILYLDGTPDNFDMIGDKYVARDDAIWTSLGFAVTGACNTNADWSEVDDLVSDGQSVGIHITYRMEQLSEEQKEMMENGTEPDPLTGVIVF